MADIKKNELAHLIVTFVEGSCREWDWDDFISVKQSDPDIEKIRSQLLEIRDKYPAKTSSAYCNEDGIRTMLAIAKSLES